MGLGHEIGALDRRSLAEIEHDIEDLLDTHDIGKLLTTIDGIGPQTAARLIAAVGDPAPPPVVRPAIPQAVAHIGGQGCPKGTAAGGAKRP